MSLLLGNTLLAGITSDTISNAHSLFDFKWTDHILNEMSWLRGDTFSWHSGDVYVAAYNHLTADLSTSSSSTETIGSYTITFYKCADGHKIVLPNMVETVNNIYNETGVTWYYILDTTNQRFKLPRTKWGFVGIRDAVGNYIAPGLPNITGSVGGVDRVGGGQSGAFYLGSTNASGSTTSNNVANIEFNASRSNSLYGSSNTVQQASSQMYLYFYVGDFSQSATEQTAGITTTQLNNKLDLDVGNATTETKQTILSWGMPDFQSGVSKSAGSSSSPNITSFDCFIRFGGSSTSGNGSGAYLYAYINSGWNSITGSSGSGLNTLSVSGCAYLPKNTQYYISTASFGYCYEYPLRGA